MTPLWNWDATGTAFGGGAEMSGVFDGILDMAGGFLGASVVDAFLQVDFRRTYYVVGLRFVSWGGTATNGR